jgi:hypothetical protein
MIHAIRVILSHLAIGMYYESDDDAETNAEILQNRIDLGMSIGGDTPWTEVLEISDSIVEADGKLVLARIYTELPQRWRDILFRRDTLIVVE